MYKSNLQLKTKKAKTKKTEYVNHTHIFLDLCTNAKIDTQICYSTVLLWKGHSYKAKH